MTETEIAGADDVDAWVDGIFDGHVRGWAWRPAQPQQIVELEVVDGDRVVGQGRADLERPDLAAAGKRDGQCGFAIPVALDGLDGAAVDLVVRVKAGGPLRNGSVSVSGGAGKVPGRHGLTPLPVKFDEDAGVIGYLEQFGPTMIEGWIAWSGHLSDRVDIEIWEADRKVGELVADIWRTDLAEGRQGDGRWGFAGSVPSVLTDGGHHVIDLRAGGASILDRPLSLQFPRYDGPPMVPKPRPGNEDDSYLARTRPVMRPAPADPLFTVVVVFYEMRREAERTLTSLTRAYQRGIGDLPYEVLCVDNGSKTPLEAEWVESFGPEFRLIRPSEILPSPCRAINEAAAAAKGRYLAIMIDGAHVLTPGVFREVWDAVEEAPGAVVAVRQWFIGGDQRWLSSIGYGTEREDMLFDRINWPRDGYLMFKIGTPIWESPYFWFAGIIESNCLFLPRDVYQRIGGMNEAFSEPGAGYANLDLFKRAASAVEEPVVALVGEASFHQFHGGTTTNVSNEEKDRRVRQYESTYAQLLMENFSGVTEPDVRLRGQHRIMASILARHRPLSPARMGITDRIRPGTPPLHLGEIMIDYLRSAYVECGLNRNTRWLGHELSLAPTDALAIQEIIHERQPDAIVAVNVEPGVVHLVSSVLRLIERPQTRIIHVAATPPDEASLPAVQSIVGGAMAPDTQAAVRRALATAEQVLVLLAPGPEDEFPIEFLRAYAQFVSPRSYLVFLGSVFGQPWLGYSRHWFAKALRDFADEAPFAIDETRTSHLITTCPLGFLQRIGTV